MPSTRIASVLPRYGLSTTLTAPALALPAAWPLLTSILAESAISMGTFVGVAGANSGTWLSLSSNVVTSAAGAGCAALAAQISNASSSIWSSPLLTSCAPALSALEALVSDVRATAPAPSLSVFLSSSMHLIVAAPVAGPRLSASLAGSLGNIPVLVNYVSPSGAFASLTTPSFASLCTALGAQETADDCGTAQLALFDTASAKDVIAAFANGTSNANSLPLHFTAAYPPVLVGTDWTDARRLAALEYERDVRKTVLPLSFAFGTLASIGTDSSASSLAVAAALAPAGVGFRVLKVCTDPSFASAVTCADSVAASVDLPAGAVCAWGGGDKCQACPSGAECPGGSVLLPRVGFWIPSTSSSPEQLRLCPEVDRLERCPGWRNLSVTPSAASAYGCGVRFRGPSCAACASGFYPSRDSCSSCPDVSAGVLLAVARPILAFVGGIVGACVILTLLFKTCVGTRTLEAAEIVGNFALWFWGAAQNSASAFRVMSRFAPPQYLPYYAIVAALQFQGVSVPPACLSSVPYQSVWIAVAIVGALLLVGAASLAAVARGGGRTEAATWKVCVPTALLRGVGLASVLAYAVLVSTFADAIPCSVTSPIAVRAYLTLNNDGRRLRAALDDATSAVSLALAGRTTTVAELEAAALDSTLAVARGLPGALAASIQVSTVLSAPFDVCLEGAHYNAWFAAVVVGALFIIGRPLLNLWAVVDSPVCNRCRTTEAVGSGARAALAHAFRIEGVRKGAQWFPPLLQLFVAAPLAASAGVLVVETDALRFFVLLSVCALVTLVGAAALLRVSPYEGLLKWSNFAEAGLLVVPAVSTLTTIAFFAATRGAAPVNPQAAIVPLAVLIIVVLLVFAYWWDSSWKIIRARRLVDRDERKRAAEDDAAAAPSLGTTRSVERVNPLRRTRGTYGRGLRHNAGDDDERRLNAYTVNLASARAITLKEEIVPPPPPRPLNNDDDDIPPPPPRPLDTVDDTIPPPPPARAKLDKVVLRTYHHGDAVPVPPPPREL